MKILRTMWVPLSLIASAIFAIWLCPSQRYVVPIAQAALGAGAIGVFVDAYVRTRFIEKLVQDTAHVLIGFEMPDLLQAKIRQIIKETVVRHDWELRYSLAPVDQGVRVHVESKYTVRSYAGEPVPYTMQLQFEEIEDAQVVEMRCDYYDQAQQFCLTGPKVERRGGVDSYRGQEISLKPGESYPMKARYSTRGPVEGSDVFVFGGHAARVTVVAEDSEHYILDLVVGEDETDVVQTPGMWTFKRGFIKGQHLRIRWRPRPGVAG